MLHHTAFQVHSRHGALTRGLIYPHSLSICNILFHQTLCSGLLGRSCCFQDNSSRLAEYTALKKESPLRAFDTFAGCGTFGLSMDRPDI